MISASGTRKIHNSLNLVVGVQILIWLLTGCYMVLMDIQFIRGQHLISDSAPLLTELETVKIQPSQLKQDYGPLSSFKLISHPDSPAYLIDYSGGSALISGQTGKPITSLLTESQAIKAAHQVYGGNGTVWQTRLILETAPDEISWAKPPLWQVSYTGSGNPRLYISAQTGELVSKRHDYWQLFDLLWMLHIMDYDTRENIHNPLLQIAALLALVSALSGVALLWLGRRRSLK